MYTSRFDYRCLLRKSLRIMTFRTDVMLDSQVVRLRAETDDYGRTGNGRALSRKKSGA